MKVLVSSDVTEKFIADAETINRRIQGTRKGGHKKKVAPTSAPAPIPAPLDPLTISVSQLSFDNMQDHFDSLVKLLTLEPNYNPNEPELSPAGLAAKLTLLQTTNQAVIDKNTDWKNALQERDLKYYLHDTALVPVAKKVKNYVLAVFKSHSAEYKNLVNLPMRMLQRKN